MKDKSIFAPILAPNESPNLDELKYPLLASEKLDGIRCIFYKGQILSRSLKPIVNKQLKEKFEALRKFSEVNELILDGEIYSPKLTFQQITSYVMTQDLHQPKVGTSSGYRNIPDHLKFYCFDCLGNNGKDEWFEIRLDYAESLISFYQDVATVVNHVEVKSAKDINDLFMQSLERGCEGLILRDPQGKYKFGRGTLKEGIIYKVKPFVTFDAQITDVVQSTEVREGAEKKINELGRSVTSKKKDDRVLIEKASAFWVLYDGKPLKVVLAMTDEEKEAVWASRAKQIGKWIEFKGMLVGAKDLPRHPVMLRYREDRNE